MSKQTSTQELIGLIEVKDRRFRIAQSVFLIIIALGIAATSVFLYSSILQSQKRNEAAIAKETEYIRCIARAYTPATDGQRITTIDLDKCKITTEARPAAQPVLQVEPAPRSSTIRVVTRPSQPALTQAPAATPTASTPPPDNRSNVQKAGDTLIDTTCKMPLLGRLCGL